MHVTQFNKYIESLYFKSDSDKSYEVIKFFIIEKKIRENHYSSDKSHKDFSQEEL